MNERISEIANKAREYAKAYVAECKHYGYYMEHNEYEIRFESKLAELIIQECVDQIRRSTPVAQENDFEEGAKWAFEESVIVIKEHFRVDK